MVHRIARLSIPEALAESLRERILSGEFKEGESLVQDAIAKEYEVSRMPVREALRQLEACGLVQIKVHKGAVVTSIPTGQIAELFELRALLECEVLARAIPRMTDLHLANAAAILTRLEAAYQQEDVSSWGSLNWAFHRSLYAASGRIQTLLVLDGINLQTERYIRLHLLLSRKLNDAEQEHRELLRLCTLRKKINAVRYLRQHVLSTGRTLLAEIEASRGAKPVDIVVA